MQHPPNATPPSLEYATLRTRRPWKPYLLGVVTTPAIYLLLYAVLRVTGVFHAYYSQGSWEIEGGTGLYFVDALFFPLAIMESDLQNRLRWLTEPIGP
ncbi:MAG: hypothetical protein H7144_04235 [Burkholderiales bacterium]|nr:hypothetical protein [Phycisphaerae bacterium]